MKQKTIFYLLALSVLTACSTNYKATRASKRLSDYEKLNITTMFIDATRYKVLHDINKAKNIYTKILELDPMHDASMYELAIIESANNNTDNASLLMQKAVKISPNNYWYNIVQAQILSQAGKNNEAAQIYKSLINRFPPRHELYDYEAQCYMQSKDFQKAIDTYNKYEDIIGINENIGIQKYYIYKMMGNLEKAMDEIKELAKNFPENVQYSLALVEWYMNSGKANLALKNINSVLAVDPENALAHAYFADYYHLTGNDESAIKEIFYIISSKTINIDEKIGIMMNIYSTKNIYGNTEVVYELLDTLISVNSNEAKAYAMYADFLNDENKTNKAVDMWKRALHFDKSRYTVWDMCLSALYEQKKYDTLLVYAKEATDYFPEQIKILFFLGAAQYYNSDYKEAIVNLEIVKNNYSPKNKIQNEITFLLAKSFFKSENFSKSDPLFEEYIKTNPENKDAMNLYAYSLAIRNLQIDKAKQLVDFALSENADKWQYLHTLGLVYFRMKNMPDAIYAYEKAIANGGENDANLLEQYGDALMLSKREKDAISTWQKAIKIEGHSKLLEKKLNEKTYYE